MRVSQTVQWMSLQAFLLLQSPGLVSSFTTGTARRAASNHPSLTLQAAQSSDSLAVDLRTMVASAVVASALLLGPAVSFADEYGVEVDAPTLFTGEEVMICKKRGPLGACTKTEARTGENDNDRAKAYFQDPSAATKEKQAAMLKDMDEGNTLIEKLRQQTVDNKEKNDLSVARKTFENDQSASFGPFDRQTVILNTDGKTYTLLENPQAMRLKKAGFIKNRQFVTQPTTQEIDDALEAPVEGGGLAGAIQGIFGGSE